MDALTIGTRKIPLFVTVFMLFLFVALAVGTTVMLTNYFEMRRTALRVAADRFHATMGRINEQRLSFFAPAFLMTSLLRNAPSLQTSNEAKDVIKPLILSSLKTNPQISAVYVGYDDGNYFQILSISAAEKAFLEQMKAPASTRFAIQEIRAGDGGIRNETWQFLDGDSRLIGNINSQTASYDPRRRDWYQDAMEHPKNVVRTMPYQFATTSQVGLTLAQALDSGGVVGIDITIDRLMLYVRAIRMNESHRFIAFDDKKRLIAHYEPEKMFRRTSDAPDASIELASADDVDDPVVREGLRFFARNGPYEMTELTVAGTSYLATVDRQVARDGGVFFQLYAAPLSDFQGSLADAARRHIPVALLIFLFALPAIFFLARSISRPLVRLSGEAEAIRSFQLDEPIKMNCRVYEINTLIRSMSGMKSTIREVSKFVPKALVREILESETQVVVGGETRRISILFTDVKDFTPIAEGMSPESLMANMSEYFEELASLVLKSNGTVDKFIGDAIFAFWNAPLTVARHEHLACMTALQCRAASTRLNATWTGKGLAPWHTRFGLHVGQAVLGNVGSSDRIDYTAVGDNVNVAARLEGLNKFYGTNILTSGQIAAACSGEYLFRQVDRTKPKGVGHPLDVFELLGIIEGPDEFRVTPAAMKFVDEWNDVLDVYGSQDWLRALDAIEAFAERYPSDVLAGIYLDRIVGFLLEPPPEAWDGTTHFARK